MQVQNYFSMQKGAKASNQEPANDSCHCVFCFNRSIQYLNNVVKKPLLKMNIWERKDQIMKIFAVDFCKVQIISFSRYIMTQII